MVSLLRSFEARILLGGGNIAVGDRVRISGLQSAAHLNGQVGEVIGSASGSRIAVKLLASSSSSSSELQKPLAVKPANLTRVDARVVGGEADAPSPEARAVADFEARARGAMPRAQAMRDRASSSGAYPNQAVWSSAMMTFREAAVLLEGLLHTAAESFGAVSSLRAVALSHQHQARRSSTAAAAPSTDAADVLRDPRTTPLAKGSIIEKRVHRLCVAIRFDIAESYHNMGTCITHLCPRRERQTKHGVRPISACSGDP